MSEKTKAPDLGAFTAHCGASVCYFYNSANHANMTCSAKVLLHKRAGQENDEMMDMRLWLW